MTMVKQLMATAFRLAFTQHREIRQAWLDISHRIGGFLPESELWISIQRIGDLDIVLRCMEEEAKVDNSRRQELVSDEDFSFNYQFMLSEVWTCKSYEVFRLLQSRKLLSQNNAMERISKEVEPTRPYEYSRFDPRKAHIMGKGLSDRGSVMWEALDGASCDSRWLERLSLSERTISLWQPDIQTPESTSV